MPQNQINARFRELKKLYFNNMVSSSMELPRRHLSDFPEIVWLYYSDSLFDLARYSEAISALRRGAKGCPPKKLYLVYHRFGNIYKAQGNFRRAEVWYRKAVRVNPSDASHHIFLGALLAVSGRLREAEAVHRRATRCEKGAIDEAFSNLGFVLRAQERYVEAIKCFRKTLKIDPKDKDAKKALADIQNVIRFKTKKVK
jgi:Flp pilus assembly protein TadD